MHTMYRTLCACVKKLFFGVQLQEGSDTILVNYTVFVSMACGLYTNRGWCVKTSLCETNRHLMKEIHVYELCVYVTLTLHPLPLYLSLSLSLSLHLSLQTSCEKARGGSGRCPQVRSTLLQCVRGQSPLPDLFSVCLQTAPSSSILQVQPYIGCQSLHIWLLSDASMLQKVSKLVVLVQETSEKKCCCLLYNCCTGVRFSCSRESLLKGWLLGQETNCTVACLSTRNYWPESATFSRYTLHWSPSLPPSLPLYIVQDMSSLSLSAYWFHTGGEE